MKPIDRAELFAAIDRCLDEKIHTGSLQEAPLAASGTLLAPEKKPEPEDDTDIQDFLSRLQDEIAD